MGVAGSGKTVVGKGVARRLNWLFLDADVFHPAANIEKMKHVIPLTMKIGHPGSGHCVTN